MDTGDPYDLITLLFLLENPDFKFIGVSCWQSSTVQIGLFYVLQNYPDITVLTGDPLK